eukprot:6482740-Amphidinium_carterae.1
MDDSAGPPTPGSVRSERRALRAKDHQSTVAPSPGSVPVPPAFAPLYPLAVRDVPSHGALRDGSSPRGIAAAGAASTHADASSASATLHATPPRTSQTSRRAPAVEPLNVNVAPFARAMSTQPPVLQPSHPQLEPVSALPLPTASDGTKRFRSGAPPAAPPLSLTFQQCAHDPHALRQWKRKVKAWELRASQHVPQEELALLLVEALSGDPALLCQDLPLSELYTPYGVQRIIDQLLPLEQQRVHSFQQAMRAYEQLKRAPAEATRAYHARFLSCEQQLLRLGLSGYSDESRAIKWFSGLDLPP